MVEFRGSYPTGIPTGTLGRRRLFIRARSGYNQYYADSENNDRYRGRHLRGFLFIHGGLEGANFCHFFPLVVVETWVDKSNHTQNQEDDSKKEGKTLHESRTYHKCSDGVKPSKKKTPQHQKGAGV
jgi:hypothetical protein